MTFIHLHKYVLETLVEVLTLSWVNNALMDTVIKAFAVKIVLVLIVMVKYAQIMLIVQIYFATRTIISVYVLILFAQITQLQDKDLDLHVMDNHALAIQTAFMGIAIRK